MVSFSEVLLPIAIILGFTVITMVVFWLIFKKDSYKGGIVTSFFLALFFSYGRIYEFIVGFKLGNFVLGRHIYLSVLWLILFIIVAFFTIRTKVNLRNLINILNIVSAVLIIIPLINIGIYNFNTRDTWQDPIVAAQEEGNTVIADQEELPDVNLYILQIT